MAVSKIGQIGHSRPVNVPSCRSRSGGQPRLTPRCIPSRAVRSSALDDSDSVPSS